MEGEKWEGGGTERVREGREEGGREGVGVGGREVEY